MPTGQGLSPSQISAVPPIDQWVCAACKSGRERKERGTAEALAASGDVWAFLAVAVSRAVLLRSSHRPTGTCRRRARSCHDGTRIPSPVRSRDRASRDRHTVTAGRRLALSAACRTCCRNNRYQDREIPIVKSHHLWACVILPRLRLPIRMIPENSRLELLVKWSESRWRSRAEERHQTQPHRLGAVLRPGRPAATNRAAIVRIGRKWTDPNGLIMARRARRPPPAHRRRSRPRRSPSSLRGGSLRRRRRAAAIAHRRRG